MSPEASTLPRTPDNYGRDGLPHLVSEEEYWILQRYRKPRIIESEDERKIVHYLSQMGFMTRGIHEGDNLDLHETAQLTELGERMFYRERMIRSPIRRWLATLNSKML
jgi:hypothetical protein